MTSRPECLFRNRLFRNCPSKNCRTRNLRFRNYLSKLVGGLMLGFGMLVLLAPQLQAQEAPEDLVIVIKVDGFLDDIVANFIEESIQEAEEENALALVLQVNSSTSILSNNRFEELTQNITTTNVLIASWVGPSGARATGRVAELVLMTDSVGISPGARIGNTDSHPLLKDRTIGYEESLELGIATLETPTIGDLLVQLEGFKSEEVKDDETCTQDCLIHLEPVTKVRFDRLSFLDQAMHTVASPPVAYLLFSFGLALIVLEYYTAGIGISGVVGAAAFLLGVHGFVALPTNLWAAILLLLGIFGYAIDIQTGVPRLWTIIATGAYLSGSIFLYSNGVELSWILLLIGVGGMLLGMVGALPVLVRSRFTTPTIGREWMIGKTASVVEDLNPEGIIKIHQAIWRARTYRATTIVAGSEVEITGLDNLILEVEHKDESES